MDAALADEPDSMFQISDEMKAKIKKEYKRQKRIERQKKREAAKLKKKMGGGAKKKKKGKKKKKSKHPPPPPPEPFHGQHFQAKIDSIR